MKPEPAVGTHAQAAADALTRSDGGALTWRSAIIGLAGVILLCSVTPYNDFHLHQTYLYGNHFPLGCLFVFTVLAAVVNQLVRRVSPRRALRQPELLTIWAMLISGSGLASSGLMRYLGPIPLAPFYFGNESNGWTEWTHNIPAWMVPSTDGQSPVIRWFFEGLPQGEAIPWAQWVHVFICWGILFGLVTGLSVCLCVIARKQWVDRERLTFPLVHIPIEMSREPEKGTLNSFFRNRLMWLGVGLTVALHGINGLHSYWVSVPSFPLQWEFPTAFPDPPWNAMGFSNLEVFLSVVGIMFLVPAEVSFSLWSFYALFRLLRAFRVSLGMEALAGAVPNHEAALGIGGFLVWGVWMVLRSRAHLASVWRDLRGTGDGVESNEPIALRTAATGAIISFLGAVLWTTAAGVPPLLGTLIWAGVALILVVLTRIVAESGLLFVQSPFVPTDAISAVPGMRVFDASGLGPAMMTETVVIHDPRESLMPSIMNSLRLKGSGTGRQLLIAVLMAVAVGYVVSFIVFVTTSYRYGGLNLDAWGNIVAPQVFYGRIAGYSTAASGFRAEVLCNIAIGGVLTGLLLALRGSLVWWPFHPLGLLLAGTYAMGRIWFSVMIAWALKWLVLRYGGLRMFRVLLPFFLGMVVGEGIIGGIWVIVGMITGVGTPGFLPS